MTTGEKNWCLTGECGTQGLSVPAHKGVKASGEAERQTAQSTGDPGAFWEGRWVCGYTEGTPWHLHAHEKQVANLV